MPDRASKFGTELSELLSARNARKGGPAVRSAVRQMSRAEREPKERESQARVWMDWDRVCTHARCYIAYTS